MTFSMDEESRSAVAHTEMNQMYVSDHLPGYWTAAGARRASLSSDDAIGAKRRGRDSDRIMCRVLDDYIVAARRGEAPGRLRGNRREPRRERLTSTTRGTGPMKLDPPAACTESQGSGRVWNPLSSVFWTWPGKSSWTSWRRPGWTSSPCRWTSSCRWSSWRRWSSWPWSKSSSWTQPGW